MRAVLDFIERVCAALGRCEFALNNPAAWDLSRPQIDTLTRPETPDCADCTNRRMGHDVDVCPHSKKTCGHHCNHSWSHDSCCWCSAEWGEDGVRLDRMSPAKRAAYEAWFVSGDEALWRTYENTP